MRAAESAAFTARVLDALPGSGSEVAQSLGRARNDGTVRRRLAKLRTAGQAEFVDGVWRRCQVAPPVEGYSWPEHFDEISRLSLGEKVTECIELGVWDDGDIDLLERLVGAQQRARLANAQLARDGFTTGGGERQFAHPLIAVAREAERDGQVYEELLRKRHEDGRADDDGDRSDQDGL